MCISFGFGFKVVNDAMGVYSVRMHGGKMGFEGAAMSSSGAVYQPTTVTYEDGTPPQRRWSISYLPSITSQVARGPCGNSCVATRNVLPIVYLTSSIACFAIGLTMLIHGAIGYSEPQINEDSFYLTMIIIGAIVFVLAFLFVALFLRFTRRLCFRTGKDHLDNGGNQVLTVNPSTDLLVTAQYAPVSEVAYQPPSEDTEQSKLMPQETKDIINEDTDRMVESDPRIVLRPLNPTIHEET